MKTLYCFLFVLEILYSNSANIHIYGPNNISNFNYYGYGDTLILLNGTYSLSRSYNFPGQIIVADNAIAEITSTVEKIVYLKLMVMDLG